MSSPTFPFVLFSLSCLIVVLLYYFIQNMLYIFHIYDFFAYSVLQLTLESPFTYPNILPSN